jgi:hypothetical protein
MKEIYFRAIRKLPDHWVNGATDICQLPNGNCVAANPSYAPMIFKSEEWEEITFDQLSKVV